MHSLDQTPDNKEHSTYAHSKAILAFDDETGIWIVHSTPKFPGI
jgi:hypothetical protein